MDTREFLTHVLPREGPYCIVARPIEGGFHHYGVDTIGDAVSVAQRQARAGKDIYIAVGALIKKQQYDPRQDRMRTVRDGANIRGLRSYTMDIDAGPRKAGNPYETTTEALADLIKFCAAHHLPKPTVVQSGFGLHVWWTLTEEVPEATWEHHGKLLSAMAHADGLRHDSGRSIDSSSILRVAGFPNQKYEAKPLAMVIATGKDTDSSAFHALLSAGMPVTIEGEYTRGEPLALGPPPSDADFGANNTNRYEAEALSMKQLVMNCACVAKAVDPENQKRGQAGVPEPVWHQVIMLAVHCKDGRSRAHDASRFDPRYNVAYVDAKFDRFRDKGMGPAGCERLRQAWMDHDKTVDPCVNCPSFDAAKKESRITSPAQVARRVKELPPLVDKSVDVETGTVIEQPIVAPPDEYVRTERGIGLKFDNPKTHRSDVVIFCPYDMYPLRMAFDEKTMTTEGALWCVNMPNEGWQRVTIPYCGTTSQLMLELSRLSIHIDPVHKDTMQKFLSNYLKRLQDNQPREMEYAKMGWRDDKHGGFVVGPVLYTKGNTVELHSMSNSLIDATGDSMHVAGFADEWTKAACMYRRPGLEAFRVNLYTGFAGAIYTLTGHGSTCFNASGAGGVGKTTIMQLTAAIWGNPSGYIVRDFTQYALETAADARHSMPVLVDEITIHNAKVIADFVFRFSGGKGKIRGQSGGGLRGTATWGTILMMNANSDAYAQMSSVQGDASPHMMRLIQIEFTKSNAIMKEEGDWIQRTAFENFGHAGRRFAAYVAANRGVIKEKLGQYEREIAKVVGERSNERFWLGWAASVRMAAEICLELDILPGFPIEQDMQWVYGQVKTLRLATDAHTVEPAEMLARFLDVHHSNTLVINTQAGNIDNVAQEPHGELLIRKETNTGLAYISVGPLNDYCVDHGVHLGRALGTLTDAGIVTRSLVYKTLGAGTNSEGGRVRCIEIAMGKLNEDK